MRKSLIQDKRGMLLASETIKMVLAVISIGFLAYLLTAIYFSNVEGKEKEQATEVVSRMSDIISSIESLDNKTSESVTEIVPDGWTIFSFTSNETKPNQCSGMSCFCFCDDVVDVFDRQLKECAEDGVCVIQENLIEFVDIEIESQTSIEIYQEEDLLGIRRI